MGNISKAKKKKKTKNRKRMGKIGNITRSSEDNLEVSFLFTFIYNQLFPVFETMIIQS